MTMEVGSLDAEPKNALAFLAEVIDLTGMDSQGIPRPQCATSHRIFISGQKRGASARSSGNCAAALSSSPSLPKGGRSIGRCSHKSRAGNAANVFPQQSATTSAASSPGSENSQPCSWSSYGKGSSVQSSSNRALNGRLSLGNARHGLTLGGIWQSFEKASSHVQPIALTETFAKTILQMPHAAAALRRVEFLADLTT
jgi:hypothetical protein